jgi:hypothetical protein
MAARLAALALLPSHVGQERISTFILSSRLLPAGFPDQRYPYESMVELAFPDHQITRDHRIIRSFS